MGPGVSEGVGVGMGARGRPWWAGGLGSTKKRGLHSPIRSHRSHWSSVAVRGAALADGQAAG